MEHFSFDVIELDKIDMLSIDPEKIELRYGKRVNGKAGGDISLDVIEYAAEQAIRKHYNNPMFENPDYNILDEYFKAIDQTAVSVVFCPKCYRVCANLHFRIKMANGAIENIPVILDLTPAQAVRVLDQFFAEGAKCLSEDAKANYTTIYNTWKNSGCPMEDHLTGVEYR